MTINVEDFYSEATIELRDKVSQERIQIKLDLDKDDPNPESTIALAINARLKKEREEQKERMKNIRPMLNRDSPLHMPPNMPFDDTVSCRSVFEMLNSHLDLARVTDAWGRQVYKYPFIWTEFLGWCSAIHAMNTMSNLMKMHEYADKMAAIRNGIPKSDVKQPEETNQSTNEKDAAVKARGESSHFIHLDELAIVPAPKENMLDVQAAAAMSNETLFNTGKPVDLSSMLEKEAELPENVGEAVKQANKLWPGSWATFHHLSKNSVESMNLRRFSCFEHEDSIYERSDGSFINRMDLVRWFEERIAQSVLNATTNSRYRSGQFVRHYKGNEYFIIASPNDLYLEETGKYAYAYLDKYGKIWVCEKENFEEAVTIEDDKLPGDDVISGRRQNRFTVFPTDSASAELVAAVRNYICDKFMTSIIVGPSYSGEENKE